MNRYPYGSKIRLRISGRPRLIRFKLVKRGEKTFGPLPKADHSFRPLRQLAAPCLSQRVVAAGRSRPRYIPLGSDKAGRFEIPQHAVERRRVYVRPLVTEFLQSPPYFVPIRRALSQQQEHHSLRGSPKAHGLAVRAISAGSRVGGFLSL